MKLNIKKILLLFITLCLIVYIGISFVFPKVLLKLSREISSSTAADFGMRYDKIEVLTHDSLILYGDFIYPFFRNFNEETSNHSMIVLHPLKYNTKRIYPFLKQINTLDVNFISFDSRGHGRSEGHLYTMGVKEAKDITAIIDYILSYNPNHSFGIYARNNTGNIALKALELDERIRYAVLENFDNHPLETIQRMNYDDVFIKNELIQDYVLNKTFNYLDIDESESEIDFNKIDQSILLLQTENNMNALNSLEKKLINSDIFKMYFPSNPYLLSYYKDTSSSYSLKDCLVDFISTQSQNAIENSNNYFFTSSDSLPIEQPPTSE